MMIEIILRFVAWGFSIFFLAISVLGALAGDFFPSLGLLIIGISLLPKIKNIGSIIVKWWMRVIGFFVGIIIFVSSAPTVKNSVSSEVSVRQSSSLAVATSQGSSLAAAADMFPVTHISDGDTITVSIGGKEEKVRIIGLDAPETSPMECFGNESSAQLSFFLTGKNVTLGTDSSDDRDNFGRLLRYVFLDGRDIGAEMIREGYAASYRKYPHSRTDSYNALEMEAKNIRAGLWASCGESRSSISLVPLSIVPAAATSKKPNDLEQVQAAEGSSCVIKGNVNSKGEMIYHVPGCGSYKRTQIKPGEGDKWFCSEAEAKTAGFRRAGNC